MSVPGVLLGQLGAAHEQQPGAGCLEQVLGEAHGDTAEAAADEVEPLAGDGRGLRQRLRQGASRRTQRRPARWATSASVIGTDASARISRAVCARSPAGTSTQQALSHGSSSDRLFSSPPAAAWP
ncbi:hypothetical protein ACFQ2B_33925 [Streptomyces stramineus]